MFGGLLASAIANMDGVRGKKSWRWVFILEGIATILVGITAYFLVADFPDEATWLTDEERNFVLKRTGNTEKSHEPVIGKSLLHFFRDPKNLLSAVIYFCESHHRPRHIEPD